MANRLTYLGSSEMNSIEALYNQYRQDPDSVDLSWQRFFEGFEFAHHATPPISTIQSDHIHKEFQVLNLIRGYRQRGHLFTRTNPVRKRRKYFPSLSLENFELTPQDLDTVFQAGEAIGIGPVPLRQIIDHLEETYCESIGVEYLYMRHPEVVGWLREKMEGTRNKPKLTEEHRRDIYHQLKKAAGFEQFIHKRFVGQKRFSLEGSEVLIPALNAIIQRGNELGAKEFFIGMAHRGRLNVLANILRKPYPEMFREFEGQDYTGHISLGDVKYHLGYNNSFRTMKGEEVKLNLLPNPSHLEAALPLVIGASRSRIDHDYQGDFNRVVPIAIHGDAAIAGQGVVYETVQMSLLEGYQSGGTIHIVINNQVGFTTSYMEARSSTYCTDVAKVTRSPVFHVNGDDVEAMVYTMMLAMEFRQKFHHDVFIDILSYRKYGHNEGDEPRFTQPTLYQAIADHPNPVEIYGQKLIKEGLFTAENVKEMQKAYSQKLEGHLEKAREGKELHIQQFLKEEWKGLKYPKPEDFRHPTNTKVSLSRLRELADIINTLPKDKPFYKKVNRIVSDRRRMIEKNHLDWGMAELLAYASLVDESHPVRLSGQDAVRGTFAHRHAEFTIEDTEERYSLLEPFKKGHHQFQIWNSPLNEYATLGFEYGYSLITPQALTIWEAQFGDFLNVAQVIIDQYICSGEEKWGLMNGIILLLPHGFEGQGPEHSSARIERFLSLAARNNMQILNCSTPANFFHAIRLQLHRDFRIPMIFFTPKSLLRHPQCVSTLEDLSQGAFQPVIDDPNTDADQVKRVVFCSGKIYYDLLKRKQELEARDIALVRLEQLHPFPKEELETIVKRYPNTLLHLWVQEEPENQGPWRYINDCWRDMELIPVARLASGSPATGLRGLHLIGQEEIIRKVFRKCNCELRNKYCALQCVEGKSRQEVLKQHYYFDDSRFSI